MRGLTGLLGRLVWLGTLVGVAVCKDCLLADSCSCGFDDGSGKVDITSLGNNDQTPRFKDVLQSTENLYYSYNPCGPFNEGDCQGAAACKYDSGLDKRTLIGEASNANFLYEDESGNVKVQYMAGSGSVFVMTEVELVCDPKACDPIFSPKGAEDVQDKFKYLLTTVCACPELCNAAGPVKGCVGATGISGGTIVLIVFFSILVSYFVVGSLYMRVAKKASGSDIIPNSRLWLNFPGLVKDGFVFVFSRCSKRGGYTEH